MKRGLVHFGACGDSNVTRNVVFVAIVLLRKVWRLLCGSSITTRIEGHQAKGRAGGGARNRKVQMLIDRRGNNLDQKLPCRAQMFPMAFHFALLWNGFG